MRIGLLVIVSLLPIATIASWLPNVHLVSTKNTVASADELKWLQKGGDELTRLLGDTIDPKRKPCDDFTGHVCSRILARRNEIKDDFDDNHNVEIVEVLKANGRNESETGKSIVVQAAKKIFRECVEKNGTLLFEKNVVAELRDFAQANGLDLPILELNTTRPASNITAAKRLAITWARLLTNHRPQPALNLLSVVMKGPDGQDRPPYVLTFGAMNCEGLDFEKIENKTVDLLNKFGAFVGAKSAALRLTEADLHTVIIALRDVLCEDADEPMMVLSADEATHRWPRFDFSTFLDEWSRKSMNKSVRAVVVATEFRIGFYPKKFDGIHKALTDLGESGIANLLALNLLDESGANTPEAVGYHKNRRRPKRRPHYKDSKTKGITNVERSCVRKLNTYTKGFVYVHSVPAANRALIRRDLKLMVKYIFAGLRSMFEQVSWLTEKTRQRALAKINNVQVNLLYPAEFETAADFDAGHSPALLARLRQYLSHNESNSTLTGEILRTFNVDDYRRSVAVIASSKAQRKDFWMAVYEDSAEYTLELNALQIPLGYTRPPAYIAGGPFAWNFGSLGSTVGHELSHGFDLKGVMFNETGYLNDWMDELAAKNYSSQARCVVDEYDRFCIVPSLNSSLNNGTGCIDGKLTNYENMADIAGLHAALRGLNHFRDTETLLQGILDKPFDKLSDEQLFFLAFATPFCNPLENSDLIDTHASGLWRIESIYNMPAFRRVFQCSESARYAPRKFCQVWITKPKKMTN